MSEYYGNNYENNFEKRNGSEFETEYRLAEETPAHQKSGKRPRRAGRVFKKAAAITLSGILFGSVAAGTFQAVNYASGFNSQTQLSETDGSGTGSAGHLNTVPVSYGGAGAAGNLDVSSIAENVMPSIVSITNKSVQEVQNYFSMFGYGAGAIQQETESCGSGIIIGQNDTELLIVTNNHVVEGADTLSVCFIDNECYEASLKGTDPDNDLAVIAVKLESISADTMSQIKAAVIGDSDALKVGEQVVAIGNALGYGQSVTTGIVSATNRAINTSSRSDGAGQTYIQTDAAINPGNSGGALVNMNGEVIGINSAKLASTEVEGMGYAIPVSQVSDIIEKLMNQTTREKAAGEERAVLGITGRSVTQEVTSAYRIPTGVYVAGVTQDGAAAKAGILQGDIITSFDGRKISDMDQLKEVLEYYKAGETVEVVVQTIENGSYAEKTVTVTLGGADVSGGTTQEPVIRMNAGIMVR